MDVGQQPYFSNTRTPINDGRHRDLGNAGAERSSTVSVSQNNAAPDKLPTPLHVLIIGGGIGGLCLAQGLNKAGVSVAVYERDRALDARLQGYRLNIEPAGSLALHACLP